jgi:hypothetical protein
LISGIPSELFLLAVANFVGEDTFYEKADDRDRRYTDLIHRGRGRRPGVDRALPALAAHRRQHAFGVADRRPRGGARPA